MINNFINETLYTTSNVRTPPTQTQIENTTTSLVYQDIIEQGLINQPICPITQDTFSPNDVVMRVNICGHIFKEPFWGRTWNLMKKNIILIQ